MVCLARTFAGGTQETAKMEVILPPLSVFSTESIVFQITMEHFEAGIQREPYIQASDIHLYHTPIKALDINRNARFRAAGQAERD